MRGTAEFSGPLGHIAGALNLPVEDFPARMDVIPPGRDVVLVCLTDKRSARAADLLAGAGRRNLSVLRGGMKEWTEAGLPSER